MEWSFETRRGAVTVRQEGERAVCQAISRPDRGDGLCKAWLLGDGGQALLGTLIPEGGALQLRRIVPISQLRRQGAWPPRGAELSAVPPNQSGGPLPEGWQRQENPGKLMGERGLSEAARQAGPCLCRRAGEAVFLAYPYSPQRPFPIPALFCLSRLWQLAGDWYVIFRLSRWGRPELPEKDEGGGP